MSRQPKALNPKPYSHPPNMDFKRAGPMKYPRKGLRRSGDLGFRAQGLGAYRALGIDIHHLRRIGMRGRFRCG